MKTTVTWDLNLQDDWPSGLRALKSPASAPVRWLNSTSDAATWELFLALINAACAEH